MEGAELKRVEIPDWICYERFENEMILLDPTTWNYYRLDSYGGVLWEKLSSLKGDVEALKRWVEEHFEGDPRQMQSDIDRFVKQLIESGLLLLPSDLDRVQEK
ncbi:PqqD family protein [Candidatus Methylacidiphilum infernorum]|uniref:PqqD family protein n=2 Tax=Candidatus Methylacidiphilum infernorum TaxID=511746 RepID=A0ABX7PYI9_9BACT|nr:PqqD family protein [Candidatus Methylacidiphilum infernorum]